jgi:putative ABC transport system permease protein
VTAAILSALAGHWRRNPLQLFTLVAGLALATALWSGVQAINAEARSSYDAAAATLGEGQFDQLTARDGGPIPLTDYIALRRAGWQVSPVVEGQLNGVRLVGLDPLTTPGGLGPVTLGGDVSAFLGGGGQLFGRAETLARLPDTGAAPVESPDVAPGTVLTDIGVAQRLLAVDHLTRLIVAREQPMDLAPLAEVAPNLALRSAGGESDIGRLTDSFHLNLTAFGFLAFAVGLFIVQGAIGLAFEQRRPVIRTLRALGVPLRRLIVLLAAEILVLALLAGIIGLGLGYLMAAALLPDVAATLRGLYGAEVSGGLAFRPGWAAAALAMSLGGAALAGAGALWQIARMPLLASARPRAWAMAAGRIRRVQTALAVALLAMSLALILFSSGLALGFVALASLLIGAALALPLLLSLVLAVFAARSRRPVAQWFWADTRQQLPGLSLALTALLLAMAANVGVSTMVSSFRTTFVGFLDQRLSSELYVQIDDPAEAPALLDWLAPQVNVVLPLLSVERDLAGLPGELFAARAHRTYPDNWRFLSAIPDPWPAIFGGTGVTVNEQMARRAGLTLGSPLTVAEGVSVPVVAIHGDYGNPIGQAIIGEDLFRTLYPEVAPTRFGLRLPPDRADALQAALTADYGLPAAAVIDQAAIKRFSLEVFDRTFTVTGALNILTLAVAGFALLMSLLTLAAMRLPQLAPVWALGMTRRDLGWLEVLRAILLAVLTGAAALPLGLALAWVLLSVVNVEAFGWQLPMFLFPADYARLGLLALVAAALAALWPALRLMRTPPADLLKVFANER